MCALLVGGFLLGRCWPMAAGAACHGASGSVNVHTLRTTVDVTSVAVRVAEIGAVAVLVLAFGVASVPTGEVPDITKGHFDHR
jgi:hypothetical protein